jgi:hypothetical protein
MRIGFWCKYEKGRDNWEDIDLDRWIILKMDFSKIGWGGMVWTDLIQDMDHWRATVNTKMKLRVP